MLSINNKNWYHKNFERTWNDYLNRNSVDIVLTGKKTPRMNKVPIYRLTGVFSGWDETDIKQDIVTDTETTVKIKISDLLKNRSQADVLDGSGLVLNEIIDEQEYSDGTHLLVNGLEIGKYYKVVLPFQIKNQENLVNKTIEIHSENGYVYRTFKQNSEINDTIELTFQAMSRQLMVTVNGIGVISIKNISFGILDGTVPCPVENIKANIEYLTVGDRTFNIEGQKLSASNSLMVIKLSNRS